MFGVTVQNTARKTLVKNVCFRNRSRNFSTIPYVADAFNVLHESSGLPWIFLIPLSTIALRTFLTLPLSILQRKRLVKQNELRNIVSSVTPVVKHRLAQTQKLLPEQITMLSIKETRRRQKSLFKKNGVEMWKNAILPLVQIPLWVTVSLGLREMTADSKKLIETNNDLNILDSTLDLSLPFEPLPMLLPIVLGSISLVNVEYNGVMFGKRGMNRRGKNTNKLSQSLKSILSVSRLTSIFMMGVSTQTSIILTLYWISSQLYSLLQNMMLDWLWPLHEIERIDK